MSRRIQNLLLCWTIVLAANLRPVPAPAGAADGAWSEFSPPHRSHHAAIIDPVLRRMIVYGGTCGLDSRSLRG